MNKLETVAQFLKGETTMALSTVGPGGLPCSAPLFYLADAGARLYWFSSRRSAHSRNLKTNCAASVAVYHAAETWRDIRGVQMRGVAKPVTGRGERQAVREAYAERFRLGTLFDAAIARSGLYVFVPEWIRYVDNSRRFGYKFEISVTTR